jgi:hypothetical protein
VWLPLSKSAASNSVDCLYSLGYIQAMKTILTTHYFDHWYGSLRDRQAKMRIAARIDRAEGGTLAITNC